MKITPYEKSIMDYFGWKSICKGDIEDASNCMNPFMHTHEFSDIDNEFRQQMMSKGLLDNKCDCGNNANENDFKFRYEYWGSSLGSRDARFVSLFFCDKCTCQTRFTKIVDLRDILKASLDFTVIS